MRWRVLWFSKQFRTATSPLQGQGRVIKWPIWTDHCSAPKQDEDVQQTVPQRRGQRNQLDTFGVKFHWSGCMVCKGAILTLVNLFTHYNLSRQWAEMKGTAHSGIGLRWLESSMQCSEVCIPCKCERHLPSLPMVSQLQWSTTLHLLSWFPWGHLSWKGDTFPLRCCLPHISILSGKWVEVYSNWAPCQNSAAKSVTKSRNTPQEWAAPLFAKFTFLKYGCMLQQILIINIVLHKSGLLFSKTLRKTTYYLLEDYRKLYRKGFLSDAVFVNRFTVTLY